MGFIKGSIQREKIKSIQTLSGCIRKSRKSLQRIRYCPTYICKIINRKTLWNEYLTCVRLKRISFFTLELGWCLQVTLYAKKVIKLKINVYNTIPKRNLIDYKKFKTINVAGIDLWFNHFSFRINHYVRGSGRQGNKKMHIHNIFRYIFQSKIGLLPPH